MSDVLTDDTNGASFRLFAGPGWAPCLTQDMLDDLYGWVGVWMAEQGVSNMDITVTIAQIDAPVD